MRCAKLNHGHLKPEINAQEQLVFLATPLAGTNFFFKTARLKAVQNYDSIGGAEPLPCLGVLRRVLDLLNELKVDPVTDGNTDVMQGFDCRRIGVLELSVLAY